MSADQSVFRIRVGGLDVTERFNPVLEHLLVRLTCGSPSHDQAHITLNDKDGQIAMPSIGGECEIDLGHRSGGIGHVFTGFIDEVQHKGSRHLGRTLVINAKSFNSLGKVKEQQEHHKDDSPLSGFMSQAAGKAGVSFQGLGSIGGINREYWAATSESFLHLGWRIAREVGANFKVIGNNAYMWPINTPLFGGDVSATWGVNLIDWQITVAQARDVFGKTRARHYDMKQMKWLEQFGTGGSIGGGATHTHRTTRGDEGEASNQADGNGEASNREGSSGSVLIIGNPVAQPEGICTVSGIKPGVDGGYRIDTVEHLLDRHEGYHTHLGLKARGNQLFVLLWCLAISPVSLRCHLSTSW
jgi:phage protein D